MASADPELCSICAGSYNNPRKLPGCIHSFCARCILNYIGNLKDEGKLGHEFECPVCTLPSEVPEANAVTLEWIHGMDIDKELERKLEGQKNLLNSDWCSQCLYLDKSIQSKYYCMDCQDSYCEKCSDMLHSFKRHKDHVLICVDENSGRFQNEAVKILDRLLNCPNHPQTAVEFYCEYDETAFCSYCVTATHRSCTNVKHISDIPKQELKSNSTQLLESAKELSSFVQAVIGIIKTNELEVKKQSSEVMTEFQNLKQKVVRLLDVMEDNLNQQCRAVTKEISIKNLDDTQTFQSFTSKLSTVTYLIENLLGKVTPERIFICVQGLKKIMEGIEGQLLELGPIRKTEGVALKIEDIFNTIINLGPNETGKLVSIDRTNTDITLPDYSKGFYLKHVPPRASSSRKDTRSTDSKENPNKIHIQKKKNKKKQNKMVIQYYSFLSDSDEDDC